MEEFDLYVAGFFPDRAERPEDGLAKLFGLTPEQARKFVRSLPRVIKHRVPADQVERYMRALQDIGADVQLRRSPLAAHKTLTIGTSRPDSAPLPDHMLALPPSASAPSTRAEVAPAAVAPLPQQATLPEAPANPAVPARAVSAPVIPAAAYLPPEPAAPASGWAELDFAPRSSLKPAAQPPVVQAIPSAVPSATSLHPGVGSRGRPAWMIEDSQYNPGDAAPQAPSAVRPTERPRDAPPRAAAPVHSVRVAAPLPSKRPPPTAAPLAKRVPRIAKIWSVRIAVQVAVALGLLVVGSVLRSMNVLGDDVAADVAGWAASTSPSAVGPSVGETAAAVGGVMGNAREWSSSTVHQWTNHEKADILRLTARLDAAGAKAVYPSDIRASGSISVASELRIELPESLEQRRAIDAELRAFQTARLGLRPAAPKPGVDPFKGASTTYLQLD